MSHRKTKKKSNKILKEILEKYDYGNNETDKILLQEMKDLLYAFVQFMTTKEVKETLLDYYIEI